MSHAPRPTGQTGTKPDKVRLCPRSNSGQTRTHPYRGVRCPEDDVVKKGGSREEVRRARVYPGTQALLDMLVRAS